MQRTSMLIRLRVKSTIFYRYLIKFWERNIVELMNVDFFRFKNDWCRISVYIIFIYYTSNITCVLIILFNRKLENAWQSTRNSSWVLKSFSQLVFWKNALLIYNWIANYKLWSENKYFITFHWWTERIIPLFRFLYF